MPTAEYTFASPYSWSKVKYLSVEMRAAGVCKLACCLRQRPLLAANKATRNETVKVIPVEQTVVRVGVVRTGPQTKMVDDVPADDLPMRSLHRSVNTGRPGDVFRRSHDAASSSGPHSCPCGTNQSCVMICCDIIVWIDASNLRRRNI